jgi:ribonuclease R
MAEFSPPDDQPAEAQADQQAAELERAVLELVQRPDYRPIKPRVIAKRLGIPHDEAAKVKKAVKRLVRRGQLIYGSSHLVHPGNRVGPASSPGLPAWPPGLTPGASPLAPAATPADGTRSVPATYADGTRSMPATYPPGAKKGRIVGLFRRREGGFGFVRPTGAAPAESPPADIYIAAEDAADASTGDTVVVELRKRHDEGRHPGPRGRIVEVLQRQTHRFVGTYYEEGGTALVTIDGTVFARPVLVGDPGASDARPDDKVVVEMVRFPSHFQEGEGVIAEILGPRGKPGVDTLSIIHEFDLPGEFPEDALAEARAEAERFEAAVAPGRYDATAETIVTIDPVDARDFDDAISLERLADGGWRLGVHIADVSYFVRPRTALDREAQHRATSVYLPDRVIPMLPEVISNALASLQPGKVRYTKTVYMDFTPEGLRTHVEFHDAAIKSAKRLAYEQVDEFLADPASWQRKLGAKVHGLLLRMHELAMILRRRRFQRGALELQMPEVKIDLDKQGRVAGAHVVRNTESHQIIEEFMLAANEAVAEMLRDRGLWFLRRIHKSPSPLKLKALTAFIADLGLVTESLESRFEIQKLLAAVAGRPEEYAVNYAVLRSLQRAVYSPREDGHYALASDCYCHFTSPIRRYPDLTVHRLMEAILTGKKPRNDPGELVMLGEHCSEREQRAESAERELVKVKLLAYMADRIGEEMDGVITGVESFGLFVQGLEIPAEGLLHVDALQDDYYRYDRAAHTLAGHRSGNTFRLGDQVRVAVSRVDIERRELDFHLVSHKRRPAPPKLAVRRGKRVSDGGPAASRKKRPPGKGRR